MLDIQMLQMSNQKYRRTNFDEEENSAAEVTPPSELPSPATNFNPTVSFQHYKVNFWRRRSSLEKILGVVVVILLVVIMVLAIVLKAQGTRNAQTDSQKAENQKLCTSKSCINAASSILNAIDDSVSPCDDFYQFSCGNWIKSHPIPAGHSKWDTFGILREANYFTLKRFLDMPVKESDSNVQKKMKDYYTSCMDPSNILETLQAKPLLELVKDVGGWSISEVDGVSWSEESWKLQDVVQKMHKLGFNVLFTFAVSEDEKEPLRNILKVDQVMTMLGKDNYANKSIENNTVLEAYFKYMVELGVMLGGDKNETKALMLEVFNFERSLNEICTSQEDKRDDEKNYNKKNISELQQLAPFMNWMDFVNDLLTAVNITIDESEPIVVYSPEFLVQLAELLNETLQEKNGKRTIHNYMAWNLVNSYSSFLSKSFRNAKREFFKVLMGTVGEEEHWRSCVSETDNILGFALGAMYVQEKFRRDSKESAEVMIRNIKKAFIGNLPNLAWMDEETRVAAVDKANAVVDKIGYPEFILNATALDLKYGGLEINKDEFFMNNFRAIKHTIKKVLEKLRKTPEKSSWGMSPPTVNAYYTPVKNEIVFPAGILQAPFYDKDFPKSLNYGAVGVVMGHELTHGFDDQGREYDKHGVLRMWWNEDSIKAFQNRTKCLIDQYSKYSVGEEHLKGKQTLGENIADNGGLKSSFYAYNELTKETSVNEPLLPGLNFSHKQLFFIAFAQVWCTTSTPGDISNSIMSDSHSLPNFRVIGSVSNLREFSEQFNCPKGSPMNPVDKCEVW